MRKSVSGALALCFSACALSAAVPTLAQDFPADPGAFWDVTMIDVTDGGDYAYTNWLATEWKAQEEFAKSKGWISDYKVMSNLYPRPGEPDLYLIVVYDHFTDAKDQIARRKDYMAFQKKTLQKLDEESGDRGKFRTVMGTSLWEELKLK
jgi:hypothetical protein